MTESSSLLRAVRGGLVVLFLGTLAGCDPGPADRAPQGRPLVVASFFPHFDLARRIGGEAVDVRCLVAPGGDPHASQGTPAAARLVADADLVLLHGLGMDGWVEKLARSERGVRWVVLTEGLPTRPEALPGAGGVTVADPHLWLDPVHAAAMARRIGAELERMAPELREGLALRTREEVENLERLDAEFAHGLSGVDRRQVVTFHGAFSYLFDRYGLEVAAVIESFPGDEPSAAHLRALVDLTRRLGIRTIMAEPQLPDRPARILAREIGGAVERLDPCESPLADEPGASYADRQRRNLAVLRRALGAAPEPGPGPARPSP